MRGRSPQRLWLGEADETILQRIARSQTLPWYQVRRARTVLGIAAGERVQTLAEQMQCAPRTIQRTCQLYQRQGLQGLLTGPKQPGRPFEISPPGASANCPTGMS